MSVPYYFSHMYQSAILPWSLNFIHANYHCTYTLHSSTVRCWYDKPTRSCTVKGTQSHSIPNTKLFHLHKSKYSNWPVTSSVCRLLGHLHSNIFILLHYNTPILLFLLLLLLLFFSLSDLSMNSIRHVPEELFQGTKKLAVLHLSRNSLKDLPKHIFQDLVHLEELDLSNNALTEIQTGVFRGTYSLKIFYWEYINFVWKCQNDIYTTLSCT